MMMDEEQALNEAGMLRGPPQQPPQQAVEGEDPEMAAEREGVESQVKPASPKDQKIFERVAAQALSALTSKDGAKMFLAAAKAGDPVGAMSQAVYQTLAAIATSAEKAGLNISREAIEAAAGVRILALSKMMESAGLVESAEQTASAAMDGLHQQLSGGA